MTQIALEKDFNKMRRLDAKALKLKVKERKSLERAWMLLRKTYNRISEDTQTTEQKGKQEGKE